MNLGHLCGTVACARPMAPSDRQRSLMCRAGSTVAVTSPVRNRCRVHGRHKGYISKSRLFQAHWSAVQVGRARHGPYKGTAIIGSPRTAASEVASIAVISHDAEAQAWPWEPTRCVERPQCSLQGLVPSLVPHRHRFSVGDGFFLETIPPVIGACPLLSTVTRWQARCGRTWRTIGHRVESECRAH